MDKEKFMKWVKHAIEINREVFRMWYEEDDKEMEDYTCGKIATLNEILVFTKRGDFDDNHSN